MVDEQDKHRSFIQSQLRKNEYFVPSPFVSIDKFGLYGMVVKGSEVLTSGNLDEIAAWLMNRKRYEETHKILRCFKWKKKPKRVNPLLYLLDVGELWEE
jgi:hypothetical protein